jgi:hypothetical protein
MEEVYSRRSPPDLVATGTTNLAALKDAAANSCATLCDEQN